jgi:hypothetical protein
MTRANQLIREQTVDVVWDPSLMSEAARLELGIL